MVRYNHEYGTTAEDFANVAVVTREWATKNPRAAMFSNESHEFGGPITVDDVNRARKPEIPASEMSYMRARRQDLCSSVHFERKTTCALKLQVQTTPVR